MAAIAYLPYLWVSYYISPGQTTLKRQFESHRAEYTRFVKLLQGDPYLKAKSAHVETGDDAVPEYRELARTLGAKRIDVWEDGSIDFVQKINGGSIMTMTYVGIRYVPHGWKPPADMYKQTVIGSLNEVETGILYGLYVVPVEPYWYVFCAVMN